jgi:apolipoprotein N-acyltransferase
MPPRRIRNLSYAAIAGLSGLVCLVIVLVALVVGLWLDAQLGRRGPFTITLLVASVPLSLYLMTRIALGMVAKIQSEPPKEKERSIE